MARTVILAMPLVLIRLPSQSQTPVKRQALLTQPSPTLDVRNTLLSAQPAKLPSKLFFQSKPLFDADTRILVAQRTVRSKTSTAIGSAFAISLNQLSLTKDASPLQRSPKKKQHLMQPSQMHNRPRKMLLATLKKLRSKLPFLNCLPVITNVVV